MNIYPRCLERLILQLPLRLLKTLSSRILQLLMAVLPPLIPSPILELRFECIISKMLGQFADFVVVDSREESFFAGLGL